jgi:aminoglycoside phosphotransferase (APT) family kinase protein
VKIGPVKKLGAGLSRDIYVAEVEVAPDPQDLSGIYVVPLPRRDAVPGLDARTSLEVALLERLAKIHVPFRVPRVIGIVLDADRPVLVREFLSGIPLDLRAGTQTGVQPWEVVGRLAAAIHKIDLRGFCDVLPGHATSLDHRLAALKAFSGLETSEVQDAYAWARAHVAPEAPSVFLHGDLLGQNVLLCPEEAPALIDWEYAMRGDPAYDLAIVTRGVRRPFQVERGLVRLLEAYGAAGGAPLTETHVRFHEICLAAGWYREALAGTGFEPPDQARQRLLGILRRAQAGRR